MVLMTRLACGILSRQAPVSYTHLDVYKRQVLMRASEMYLIEAEAKVRDGVALNQAVIPLNTLRNARGVGDYDVTRCV